MSNANSHARVHDGSISHFEKNDVHVRFRRAGAFVFISGTGCFLGKGDGQSGVQSGIRAQTSSCIEELKAILQEAGGGLENLVEVTTYLANMNDYGGYNAVYSQYFTPDGPARTTVAVQQMPHPDALIEIRGTAYIAEEIRTKESDD